MVKFSYLWFVVAAHLCCVLVFLKAKSKTCQVCLKKKTNSSSMPFGFKDQTVLPGEKRFLGYRYSSPGWRVLAVTTWVIEPMVQGVMRGGNPGRKPWMLFTVAIKLPLENRFDVLVWGRVAAL